MSDAPIRLLFVTRHAPFPKEHGSGAYAFDLLRYLASAGFEITCLWVHEGLNRKRGWCEIPAELDAVCDVRAPGYFRLGRWIVRPWLLARSLVRAVVQKFRLPKPARAAVAWNEGASSRELRAIRECAAELQPQIVLANYYWMTEAFAQAPGDPVRAVLTHDVFHQRGADMRKLGLAVNAGEVDAAEEAEQLGRAQVVIAITEEDAAAFRPLLAESEVIVASKSAPCCARAPASASVAGRCLFVGGESPPNIDGLRWFLDEVWPSVRSSRPDAELHVCGKVCEKIERLPAGCIPRGMVDDLAVEYAAAQAVIVPLRAGSGLKIKLVEALSFGCACVSTSVGTQGMNFLRHGEDLLRADEAADFSHHVLQLLGSEALRESLRTAGQAAVELHLSPDGVYGPLAERLRELARQETSATLTHAG